MISKFLREHIGASVFLMFLRIYVGWSWFSAGFHKLTGEKAFDASGFLKGALSKPIADKATGELIYPTYTSFVEGFALPNVKLINIMIPWGETLVGLGLILGCLTTAAVFFGLMMNFMFMFAGTVSTNPWLILLGFIIFMAGKNAGKFGLDYYVLPYLKKLSKKEQETDPIKAA